jgi:hypothetical protein
MTRDYIGIGPAPAEEECAQVGSPDYARRARAECRRFIELLRRTFGEEPEGAQLMIKSNPHDFGAYYEVVCYYEEGNEEAPTRWDQPSTPILSARDGQGRVCDSCLTAAYDMGLPDRESQITIMVEMGADVEDHLCDQVEDPDPGSSPGKALS